MFRRSTNNPWIPPGGMNASYFGTIGGADVGSLDNRFPGLVGATVVHSVASALQDSKLSVGTLFQGVYQLVKFAPTLNAIAKGQMVFWDVLAVQNGIANFQVTNIPATTSEFRAGVVLTPGAAVDVQGKFGYIQVAGLASMLFATVVGGVVGQLVIQNTLTDPRVINLADATQFPAANQASDFKRGPIGLAYELPVTDTVTRVLLSTGAFYPNVGRG